MSQEQKAPKFNVYFNPEIVEGEVRRCSGSVGSFDTAALAEAEGNNYKPVPFVVANEHGVIPVKAPELAKKGKHAR